MYYTLSERAVTMGSTPHGDGVPRLEDNVNDNPSRTNAETRMELGVGLFDPWLPASLTETLPPSMSSSLSPGISTIPIYDSSRATMRSGLEDLEPSREFSAPSGFETFPRSSFTPSPESFWDVPYSVLSKSDGSCFTAELNHSPTSHSTHEWSPSRRGGVETMSSSRHEEAGAVRPLGAIVSQGQAPTWYPYQYAYGHYYGYLSGARKPTLHIFPAQLVNFASSQICFYVQVINMPVDVPLNSCNVEGMAMTPGGMLLPCQLREVEKTNIYDMDLFSGSFSSLGEAGTYSLKARLILPFTHQWSLAKEEFGGTVNQAEILVSRNYFRDSTLQSTKSFKLDFVPWQFSGSKDWHANQEGRGEGPKYKSKVWGLTCDRLANRLYYTDRNGHSLTCLDTEGRIIFRVPQPTSNPLFSRPTGICYDQVHRRLIVVDKDRHLVSFLSMDGKFLTSFGGHGMANGQFDYPWDVDVSPNGNSIAVTDSRNKRVQLFDRNGNFVKKFSVYEQNPFGYKDEFDYPRGITFNRDGSSIFVTDFNTNSILEVLSNMSMYRKLIPARPLAHPQGIVMDEMGNLLVCDSQNRSIRHLHPGTNQVLATIQTVGPERLDFPVNLTLIGDGRLAVLDTLGKIRIF